MTEKKLKGSINEGGMSGGFRIMTQYKDSMSSVPSSGSGIKWITLSEASAGELIVCLNSRYKFFKENKISTVSTTTYAYMCAAIFEMRKRGINYKELMT